MERGNPPLRNAYGQGELHVCIRASHKIGIAWQILPSCLLSLLITHTLCNMLQPPFVGNRDKVQQKIVKEKLKLPSFLSSEAHSLLKGVSFYFHSP